MKHSPRRTVILLPRSPLFRLNLQIRELEGCRSSLIRNQRREDTKHKIALGGLVVKAGLRVADKAFILGTLMSAQALSVENPRWRELRQIGGVKFAATASEKPPIVYGDERRQVVRMLIELGGLVVKAGLREADKAFILGALMSAAALSEDDPRWRKLRQIGGAAFAATAVSEKPSHQESRDQ